MQKLCCVRTIQQSSASLDHLSQAYQLVSPSILNHFRWELYQNFTATATSFIWVTQNLKRCMEIASPYEGHTSCTFFVRLLDPTSGLLRYTSGLPKILPWLHLTFLMMLGLWGIPSEQPRQVDAPRATPTYYLGGCVYVHCQFTTPRWGVTHFYQCLRLCSCGTKPQHSKNHHFVMTSSWEPNVIMTSS